jgi:hypothetical protein
MPSTKLGKRPAGGSVSVSMVAASGILAAKDGSIVREHHRVRPKAGRDLAKTDLWTYEANDSDSRLPNPALMSEPRRP